MDKFENIKKIVKEKMENASGCHDWDHVERVFNLAMKIAKKEKADLEVIRYAAMLHDIGREAQDKSKGKICHAEEGARLAEETLTKYKFPQEFIQKVIHCIETHRFRKNNIPESLEAKVLFDADKIDGIGAVGIGRAFLFSGEVGARLHNKNPDLSVEGVYTREDTAYREFLVTHVKIKERMLTKTGREFAKERHDFMAAFFERLNKEIDGTI